MYVKKLIKVMKNTTNNGMYNHYYFFRFQKLENTIEH